MFLQDLEEAVMEELSWKLLQLLRLTLGTQLSLEPACLCWEASLVLCGGGPPHAAPPYPLIGVVYSP